MIFQIRRYLYGNFTERKLARLRDGRAKQLNYPGVMSFFPLIEDLEQLKEMDGWLRHTVFTSLRKRTRLLTELGLGELPIPRGFSDLELKKAVGYSRKGARLDLTLPSFVRIGTLIQRAAVAHGPNEIGRKGGPQHYTYT
jgi:hypothetical protein